MNQRVPIQYKEHKSIFQNIKKQQRSSWIKNMLQTKQKKGQYTSYRMDYPNHGRWVFKGHEHHYYYYINQVQLSKAILFYFPGLNAHGNGSAYFTINIAKKCHIDAYALDYRNFGRSSGQQRGYIESANSIIQQAQNFVDYILSQQKEKKKIFISGLSLGGAVCFKLALKNPQKYDGVIFLSPALKENKQVSPFMKKVGKTLGSLFPTLKLVNQTFDSMTKYDQSEYYQKDPYVYKGKVIPGTIKVVLDLMEEIQQEWSKFKNPFLLIQSGIDKLVDPFIGVDFEKEQKSEDKTVIYFKDMWHAVFAEEQMPDVVSATIQWLQPRTNQ